MFASKTVFVVGAGASADLGLPLGAALRDRIAETLSLLKCDDHGRWSGPVGIPDAVQNRANMSSDPGETLRQLESAARLISRTIPLVRSIDEFVDHHRGNEAVEFMAKLAICSTILQAEQKSILLTGDKYNRELNLREMQAHDAWLMQLWHMLRSGTHKAGPEDLFRNVSFVVFNYDRCLEEFLARALVMLFQVPDAQAYDIVADLGIVHPYGMVSSIGTTGRDRFGLLDGVNLSALAQNIRTFTESERDEKKMARIRELILQADNIVFLGFAFHEQNMEFLEADRPHFYPNVYATSHGIPAEHLPDIRVSMLRRWKAVRQDAHLFEPVFRPVFGAELLRTFEKPLLR